jgi:hypothetical protein
MQHSVTWIMTAEQNIGRMKDERTARKTAPTTEAARRKMRNRRIQEVQGEEHLIHGLCKPMHTFKREEGKDKGKKKGAAYL